MISHHTSIDDVAAYITALSADKDNIHVNFLKPLETVLYRAVHHFELLGAMIYYWHYLSYDLLDHMSCTLNLDDAMRELQTYGSHVKTFMQETTMVEFCETESIKRVCPPEYSEIVAELKWPDTATLEKTEHFRADYLEHYHLNNFAMILGFIQLIESSHGHYFKVTWFVAASVARTTAVTVPDTLMARYSITRLEIAGNCLFPKTSKDNSYLSSNIRVRK